MTAGLMLGISVEQPGMCMRALFQVDADGLQLVNIVPSCLQLRGCHA